MEVQSRYTGALLLPMALQLWHKPLLESANQINSASQVIDYSRQGLPPTPHRPAWSIRAKAMEIIEVWAAVSLLDLLRWQRRGAVWSIYYESQEAE